MGFIFLLERAWSEPVYQDMGWKWESRESIDLDLVLRDRVPRWMSSSHTTKLQASQEKPRYLLTASLICVLELLGAGHQTRPSLDSDLVFSRNLWSFLWGSAGNKNQGRVSGGCTLLTAKGFWKLLSADTRAQDERENQTHRPNP